MSQQQQEQSISSGQQQQQQQVPIDQHLVPDLQQLQSQFRCYLCETPKQEYSLIRTFSEIVCRGCLNYEGPDKVELLIAEARRFKRQHSSPTIRAASSSAAAYPKVATSAGSSSVASTVSTASGAVGAPPGGGEQLLTNGTGDKSAATLNRNYLDLNQRMQLIANDEVCALPLHHRINSIRQSVDRTSPNNSGDILSTAATAAKNSFMYCTNPNCDLDNGPINTASGSGGGVGGATLNAAGAHKWWRSETAAPKRTHATKPSKAQSKAEKEKRAAVECNPVTATTTTTTTTTATTATTTATPTHEEFSDYCPQQKRRKTTDQTNTTPATTASSQQQQTNSAQSNSSKQTRFETVASPNHLISKTDQQQISAAIKATARSQVVSPNKQQQQHSNSSQQLQSDRGAHGRTTTITPPPPLPPGFSLASPYAPQQVAGANSMSHRPYAPLPSTGANFNPAEHYLSQQQAPLPLPPPLSASHRDLANEYGQSVRHLQKQQLHRSSSSNQADVLAAHHYSHELNSAASMALYAAECASSPYYMRHPQAMPSQAAATGSRLTNNRLGGAGKHQQQHQQQPQQQQHPMAQALAPADLYGPHHYPIAVGPYMTPSGLAAIYCSAQYHPYHTHHHTAAALAANASAGCNSLLAPGAPSSYAPAAAANYQAIQARTDQCSDKMRSPDHLIGLTDGGLNQLTSGPAAAEPILRRTLAGQADQFGHVKVGATDNFNDTLMQQQQQQQLGASGGGGTRGSARGDPHQVSHVNEPPMSPPFSQQQQQLTGTTGKSSQDSDNGGVFVDKLQQQQYPSRSLIAGSKSSSSSSKGAAANASSNDKLIIDHNNNNNSSNNSEDGSLIILDKDSSPSEVDRTSSSSKSKRGKTNYSEDERSNHGVATAAAAPAGETNKGGSGAGKSKDSPLDGGDQAADDNDNTIDGDGIGVAWPSKDNYGASMGGSMSPISQPKKRPTLGFTLNNNNKSLGSSGQFQASLSPPSSSTDHHNHHSSTGGSGKSAGKSRAAASNFEEVSVSPSPPFSPPTSNGAAGSTRSQHAARRSQAQAVTDLSAAETSPNRHGGGGTDDCMNEIELRSKHSSSSSIAQQKQQHQQGSGGNNTQSSSGGAQMSPKSGADDKQLRSAHRQAALPHSSATVAGASSTTSAPTGGPPPVSNSRHSNATSNGVDKSAPAPYGQSRGGGSSNDSNSMSNHPAAAKELPIKTHQYNPLKCLACKERLEDRHFVQCPSVSAHKFCFACSKRSIEAQKLDNKNSKAPHDGIFCPSGNKCFLATEQTPWTFMNSEIETIFRESSRQASSSQRSSAANKAANGASGEFEFISQTGSGRSGGQKLKELMQSYIDNSGSGGGGGSSNKTSKKHSSRGAGLASDAGSYHGSLDKSSSGAGGNGSESTAQTN